MQFSQVEVELLKLTGEQSPADSLFQLFPEQLGLQSICILLQGFLLSMLGINLSSVFLNLGEDILPCSFWQQWNLDKSQPKPTPGSRFMCYTRPHDDSHASNHNDLSSVIISLHLYLLKPHYTQLVRRYLNVAGKIHFWGNSASKATFGTLRMTWTGRN